MMPSRPAPRPSQFQMATQPGTAAKRYAERFLFVAGVVLLSIYAGALGYARLSQAYYSWAFERVLHGQPAPLAGFLAKTLLRRAAPESAPRTPTPNRASEMTTALPLKPGSLIGRLEIPAINLSVMVIEGTGRKELSEGVGHIEGTALPGEPGNFGIAGHRDSFFRALKDISGQDLITLTTFAGSYRYRVEETKIVRPSDTTVLDKTSTSRLTLVTCYPFYYIGNAPKRYIVRARLLGPDNEH
jgi:sortase A